jgi:hypothetical protein
MSWIRRPNPVRRINAALAARAMGRTNDFATRSRHLMASLQSDMKLSNGQ